MCRVKRFLSVVGLLTIICFYALLSTSLLDGMLLRKSQERAAVTSMAVAIGVVEKPKESNWSTECSGLCNKHKNNSTSTNNSHNTTAKWTFNSSSTATEVAYQSKEPRIDLRVNGDLKRHCSWVNFTVKGPPYFLTAVFIVRIYEKDKSELTTAEVRQWLVYLRYAGIEHVYLYDLWYLPGESQREALDDYIKEGYLTYTDWHKYNPYVREKSQLPAYQHCLDNFRKESTWQAAIDIDEYPFSPDDTEPGFMNRFVKKFSEQYSDVSEITMQNFLYLGKKNKSKEFLMEQLWRHTHGPSNALVKPIYKPPDIRRAQVHHNGRLRGLSKNAPTNELRMNHYWGARLQNWGPDTKESLAKTEEDHGVEPIIAAFKKCETYIRPYL